MKLILGDSLHKLRDLPSETIDAVVTDPPYGLKFMGKQWDHDVPGTVLWREVFRVLKPGGHLLSFFGTRTYHAGVSRIEEAGFEVRDMLSWLYGSGFPKSLDVSKAIDKAAGAERTESYVREDFAKRSNKTEQRKSQVICGEKGQYTLPASDAAKQWQGFGTALKPANEPIVLARKPLSESTVAKNVLKHGTGALNIDGSRIGTGQIPQHQRDFSASAGNDGYGKNTKRPPTGQTNFTQGRWPANVLFDEEAAAMLDVQSGPCPGPWGKDGAGAKAGDGSMFKIGGVNSQNELRGKEKASGASRFFYVAKASKRERNAGLEGMPDMRSGTERMNNSDGRKEELGESDRLTLTKNGHPTVKPIRLMEYLCKLITPPGGIILDPFMGSGTTGCAAVRLGFQFIGIEREVEYLEIARKRIEHAQKHAPGNEQTSLDLDSGA